MKMDEKGQEGGPIWTLPIMGVVLVLIGLFSTDSFGKALIIVGIIFITMVVVIALSIRYMPGGSAPKEVPKKKTSKQRHKR